MRMVGQGHACDLHPVLGREIATAGSLLQRFWYGAATAAVAIDATITTVFENSMMTDWQSKGDKQLDKVKVGPVYIPEDGA